MAVDPTRAIQRSIGVSMLNVDAFELIEADESATGEAGVVVVLATVIGSLGALFINGLWGFLITIALGLAGWFIWAWLAAFIAEKVFNIQTTDTGEMLRTTGYAHAPRVIGIVPFLGFIGALWSLVAVIVGMRQAGEMTTIQAILTAVIGFIPYLIGIGIVTAVLT